MWAKSSATLYIIVLSGLLGQHAIAGPIRNDTLVPLQSDGPPLKQVSISNPGGGKGIYPSAANTTENTGKPRNIGVVAFPGWQPLDIMGPLDALWGLSIKAPINLYFLNDKPGTTSNFLPGTTLPGSKVAAVVNVDYTFDKAPPLDVLLVPGGMGTRAPEAALAPHIKFVKDTYPSLKYIISVCTGASILGRAGILDGKQATTNKAAWDFATQWGKNVKWQPSARYVHDGNVWSTSGVSAGTDGVIAWIGSVWGDQVATKIANEMEWSLSPADGDKFGKLYGRY
ncbi:hypothetical protein H072_484 [Dactylellina haptotyla CBS 200.50]|uniref:DJ-1/PfpI domain-containing protein n=1 Tax=Dactylellina haptotyla (strain CBS 200.50) TaxID=1284197 RepID=S8CD12_DACHA|nr:hypothetical protein H072_484 [Dactylellina haptotyla CBS 200.50]